jgi:hypothetical protein
VSLAVRYRPHPRTTVSDGPTRGGAGPEHGYRVPESGAGEPDPRVFGDPWWSPRASMTYRPACSSSRDRITSSPRSTERDGSCWIPPARSSASPTGKRCPRWPGSGWRSTRHGLREPAPGLRTRVAHPAGHRRRWTAPGVLSRLHRGARPPPWWRGTRGGRACDGCDRRGRGPARGRGPGDRVRTALPGRVGRGSSCTISRPSRWRRTVAGYSSSPPSAPPPTRSWLSPVVGNEQLTHHRRPTIRRRSRCARPAR